MKLSLLVREFEATFSSTGDFFGNFWRITCMSDKQNYILFTLKLKIVMN
jgi:hypothetical protein